MALLQMTPAAVAIGIMVGGVSIYLYLQHENIVTAQQHAMLSTQRCASARFDVTFDQSSGDPQSVIAAAERRAKRICADATRARTENRQTRQAVEGAQQQLSNTIMAPGASSASAGGMP